MVDVPGTYGALLLGGLFASMYVLSSRALFDPHSLPDLVVW
jgi:hypothetical protein